MCQNKSNLNTNVYSLGIVDRDQKIIPTYSRTKKARRLFSTNASLSIAMDLPSSLVNNNNNNSSSNINTSHYHKCNHCDYTMNLEKNEPSEFCDKEMSTSNMDQSSCILTHTLDRFHRNNDEDRMESTRIGDGNIQPNVHLENTQFANMINSSSSSSSSSSRQFNSCKTENATHRHRTVKKIGSTKASDCLVVIVCLLILVVHQVFAKPIDNQNYRSNMASDSHSLQDKLRSPCREDRIPAQEDHNQANIKGILKVIKTQSAIAKSIARQDVAQYLKITEDTSVDDFHSVWSAMEQLWLYPRGKFPKGFGEAVPMSIQMHFKDPASKFNDENMKQVFIDRLIKLLQECDERFQLLLIGFHNILDDHSNKRSTMDLEKYNPLFDVFSRAKNNSQMVLCEIRTALHKLGAKIILLNPQSVQSSKAQNSNFYDWVIFREYINQLEHINEIANIIIDNIE